MTDYPNTLDRPAASISSGETYISTGDVTLGAQASWTAVAGLSVAISAAVGDYLAVSVACLLQEAGSDFLDLAVIGAGSTIVRRCSTGTSSATTSNEGEPMLYPNPQTYRAPSAPFSFTVGVSDLVSGAVTVQFIARGTGGSKIFASTNYPLRFAWTRHA